MMKVPSVKLQHHISRDDAKLIAAWLEDREVTRYLNELPNTADAVKQLLQQVHLPALTHFFCQDGRFLMIHTANDDPIGFVKLVPDSHESEIVIVIGDRTKWGLGLGTTALHESLKLAFFELRTKKVIAKIHDENSRSLHIFRKAGFQHEKNASGYNHLSYSSHDYLSAVLKQA